MSHIFISHSAKDAAIAGQLVNYLESKGQQCWIAPRNIAAGRDYTDVINEALEGCSVLVFILSPNSLASQWVKKEIAQAMSMGKQVLPFKIAKCQLSSGYLFMLNNVQIIDAVFNTTDKFSILLGQVTGIQETIPIQTSASETNKKKLVAAIAGIAVVAIAATLLFVFHPWRGGETVAENDTTTADSADTQIASLEEIPATLPTQIATTAQSKNSQEKKTDNTAAKKNEKNTAEPKNATDAAKDATPAVAATAPSSMAPSTATTTAQTASTAQTPSTTQPTTSPAASPATTNTASANTTATASNTSTANETKQQKTETKKKTKSEDEIIYERRFNLAKSYYNNGNYSGALKLFQELHKKNPKDKRISPYINSCKQMLNQ